MLAIVENHLGQMRFIVCKTKKYHETIYYTESAVNLYIMFIIVIYTFGISTNSCSLRYEQLHIILYLTHCE